MQSLQSLWWTIDHGDDLLLRAGTSRATDTCTIRRKIDRCSRKSHDFELARRSTCVQRNALLAVSTSLMLPLRDNVRISWLRLRTPLATLIPTSWGIKTSSSGIAWCYFYTLLGNWENFVISFVIEKCNAYIFIIYSLSILYCVQLWIWGISQKIVARFTNENFLFNSCFLFGLLYMFFFFLISKSLFLKSVSF